MRNNSYIKTVNFGIFTQLSCFIILFEIWKDLEIIENVKVWSLKQSYGRKFGFSDNLGQNIRNKL